MSNSSRPSSPLASHGPRKRVWVSKLAADYASQAAAAKGLTQRIVLDELLGNPAAVAIAAENAAVRLGLMAAEKPGQPD